MYKFKSSINPKFDFGDDSLIYNYIPTHSHLGPFADVIISANSSSNQNSHLIIGAYGTGKSYLSTVLIGILSQAYPMKAMNLLSDKLQGLPVDSSVLELIKPNERRLQYIPVILSGYEGEFRGAILDAIYSSLNRYSIEIDFPGQISTIVKTINRWKKDYPNAYHEFSSLANKNGYSTGDEFVSLVKSGDLASIKAFAEIYSRLTFGETLPPDSSEINFVSSVEYILDQLNALDLGIVILYDEFGRFLQSQDSSEIYKTLQDIQDLSELANNGSDNLQLLFVSHKDFAGYYSKEKNQYQDEFKRVEGRFKQHIIKTDERVFSTIIKTWFDNKYPCRKISEEFVNLCKDKLRLYDIFDLPSDQLEQHIIRGSYPIHPVTLFLLTRLSGRFGQNERTLYTFFDQNEGVDSFFDSFFESKVMYPDYLYEYFFPEISSDPIVGSLKRKTNSNLSIHDNNFKNNNIIEDHRVYIFVTLWEAAELIGKQPLTKDFISFCLGISVDSSIERLIKSGILRYNYQKKSYETKQPSPINVNKLILDRMSADFGEQDFSNTVEEYLEKKYVKAFEYNRIKKMVRYADIKLYELSDYDDLKKIVKSKTSDMTIHGLIINSDALNSSQVINSVLNSLTDSEILYIPRINYRELRDVSKRLSIIKELSFDKELQNEGEVVLDELYYFLENAEVEMQRILAPINKGGFQGEFYHEREKVDIRGETDLSAVVSKQLFEMYPNTPVILNENFNKMNITPVQRKASMTVIDSILSRSKLSGNGPDSLIAYSVFTSNGFDYLGVDNSSSKLRDLQILLESTLKQKTKLSEIINVFINDEFGYGIRKPLIPVLFTGLLNNIWDNLMFFNNGSIMSNLTSKNIVEMFDHPDGIAVNYFTYSDAENRIIHELIASYDYSKDDQGQPNHIKAGNILYRWLKSLPRYTQISFDMDQELIDFRDLVNYFSINPIETIDKLSTIGIDKIRELRIELDSYLINQNEKILQNMLSQNDFESLESLRNFVISCPDKSRLSSKAARLIVNDQETNLVSRLSEVLIGVKLGEWSDNTKKVFLHEFKKEIDKLRGNKVDNNQILINLDGHKAVFLNTELSVQAENLLNRIIAMVNAQNQRVSRDEIKLILFKALLNLVEEEGTDE